LAGKIGQGRPQNDGVGSKVADFLLKLAKKLRNSPSAPTGFFPAGKLVL